MMVQPVLPLRLLLFVSAILIGLFGLSACGADQEGVPTVSERSNGQDPRSPNIILILADDLGIEAISPYGGTRSTPNIARMAENGVQFGNFFATPLCTPSRTRLLTGKHNYRNYEAFGYLGPRERTLGHSFTEMGYATGYFGKWQLAGIGALEGTGAMPHTAGFQQNLIWHLEREERGSRYWKPRLVSTSAAPPNITVHGEDVFGPDVLNQAVLDFIELHKEKPFFALYSLVLPHDPFVTTPKTPYADNDASKFDGMVDYMDHLVGNILSHVDSLNLAEQTLIIFVGDNGTDYKVVSEFGGRTVKGGKGQTIRTGMQVPFIAYWPGSIPKGHHYQHLVELLDIYPTLLEVSNISAAEGTLDGVSVYDALLGGKHPVRDAIYMHYDPRWSRWEERKFAFDERYKLDDEGNFYDHLTDPLEQNALDVTGLGDDAKRVYERLSTVLANQHAHQ